MNSSTSWSKHIIHSGPVILSAIFLYFLSILYTSLTESIIIMRSSSGMSSIFRRGFILTFAITFQASGFVNEKVTITAAPAVALIMARGQIVDGPCGSFDRWVPAQAADTCQSFADRYGITVDRLEVLNPDISLICDDLTAGDGYCIGTIGSVSHPPFSCSSL